MNLKNQPTVMMPVELMFEAEREWKMSKAAWMDVAWDIMEQLCLCEGSGEAHHVIRALKDRCELIQMHRKHDKDAS